MGQSSAEIQAIHRAVTLCVSNTLLHDGEILIVSDSKTAVSWINNLSDFGSIHHVNLIYDIKSDLKFLDRVEVVFKPRGSNSLADSLAKRGSGLKENKLIWSDSSF
ncbi:hypothetical protein Dsin_002405 [Dipteronia sinensis]|uniref:RNase H type-1 domain-containing protein n=1 Tax=Dipteronia sinensis TaxID=43782 RepID=A0AAE0B7F5_9ROSI|nr:hypothetical protein Dsin_002405 [Dipteronia sinensis]